MKRSFYLLAGSWLILMACKKGVTPNKLSLNATKANMSASLNGVSGTIYYVDPAGSDSNNGLSTTTAWATLAKVNSTTFSPGDEILFKAGATWTGQLLPKGSGSSGSAIIIDMYGTGNKPVINGSGADTTAAVKLVGQSYWQVKDLEVTNTQASGGTSRLYGIWVKANTSTAFTNVQILNCYIHNVNSLTTETNPLFNKGTGGIIIGGNNNNVLIHGCHVKDVTVEGIRNSGGTCSHILIDSNLIENVYGDGIVLNGANTNSAITRNIGQNLCYNTNTYNYAGMWTSNSVGTLVAHNEVSGITGGGLYDGEAFDADLGVNGDVFEYNYTHDNKRGFMLFMPNATNVLVRYNLSVNDISPSGGSDKMINYTSNNTTNQIYNNTFYFTGSVPQFFEYTNTGSTFAFNSVFSNNIVAGGTVTQFSSRPITAATFKNNCFYPSTLISTNGPGGTVSGDISSDPKFVNPVSGATTNFNLQSTSPCLNAGTLISSNGGVDYYGTALPAGAPDMGFYQHATSTSNFAATADSYVRDGSYAAVNYGTATILTVKSDAVSYNRKAYAKFNFTSMPATRVQSATISLYASAVNTDPTRTISVYTTNTENWGETTINWNNAPMDTVYVGKIVVTAVGTYSIDVTSAINRQLSNSDHIGSFLFLNKGAPGSKGDMSFNSREASGNNPQLTITY